MGTIICGLNRFTTFHHGPGTVTTPQFLGEISEKIHSWRADSYDIRRRCFRRGAPLTFTFSDVHANKTAMETDTFAVNNAGTIAGDCVAAKGVQHGMILAGKKLTTINDIDKDRVTSGGFTSGAIAFYGINSAGAAAGLVHQHQDRSVRRVCIRGWEIHWSRLPQGKRNPGHRNQ
jgi:hypothetical protein